MSKIEILIPLYPLNQLYFRRYFYFLRHASEICNMALDLKAACGSVVRPDIAPRTITIKAGIHTGNQLPQSKSI